jgi:protein TonB
MGYQALLFCPDEKLARVVSQVFGELEFTVIPVHEAFAAVKKLMSQRYDAIVVDCENEQNASLLFKSARNSSSNQSSLAIALVEGQAGVAKAYRIGANLVLTKPINIEQSKGTLRVARGLLRKNADAAAAVSPAPPAAPISLPLASGVGPAAIAPPPDWNRQPGFEAAPPSLAASVTTDPLPSVPAPLGAATALSPEIVPHQAAGMSSATLPPSQAPVILGSVSGSAAAPAPAKELPLEPTPAPNSSQQSAAGSSADDSGIDLTPSLTLVDVDDAPSFGVNQEEHVSGSGGQRRTLLTAAVVLALAALGYLGYGRLYSGNSTAVPQTEIGPSATVPPAPVVDATSKTAVPSSSGSGLNSATSAAPASAPKNSPSTTSGKAIPGNEVPSGQAGSNAEPTPTQNRSSLLHVKSTATGEKPQTKLEEAAPQLSSPGGGLSATDTHLNGLLATSASLPKGPSSTLRISQGVSQGLLIKRVQPKYPPAALAVHAHGEVQIEATINKEGTVINPKILSGDPILAHAAVEAVRQWRYKPYYLDGQPVEIQTQITVNFKEN